MRWFVAIGPSLLSCWMTAAATQLPVGFVETSEFSGPAQIIDLAWDPAGVLWVATKAGEVWLDRPQAPVLALNLGVHDPGDAGLEAIALDPDHSSNDHVWLYYTSPAPHTNRVSRFTRVDDQLTDELIVLELPWQSPAYNGGCLGFFEDDTIYVTNGFDGFPAAAADPFSLRGALVRMQRDGTAPPDNPFVDGVDGHPLTYSYGLRNPFRCSLQPGTMNLFMGDVGTQAWEEINVAVPGGNFGFPTIEGPEDPPDPEFSDPFYTLPHMRPEHHAIIAGDFAEAGQFPAEYEGDYFFADHNQKIIYRMRLNAFNEILSVEPFATDADLPVALRFGPDGGLYYAGWASGEVRRIAYAGSGVAGGLVGKLRVRRGGVYSTQITLNWSESCNPGDDDFAVYEGTIGAWDQVTPKLCSTGGSLSSSFWPNFVSSTFYLVVPHNGSWQGSFGSASSGQERKVISESCVPRSFSGCP